jgi:hypothetical protein
MVTRFPMYAVRRAARSVVRGARAVSRMRDLRALFQEMLRTEAVARGSDIADFVDGAVAPNVMENGAP